MQTSKQNNSFSPEFNKRLKSRYRAEQRFKFLGIGAIFIALAFLVFLLSTVTLSGYSAFKQTYIMLDVTLDKEYFPDEDLAKGDFQGIVKKSLYSIFSDVSSIKDKRMLNGLVSKGAAFQVMDMVKEDPKMVGTSFSIWVPAKDDVDMLMKGNIDMDQAESNRRIKDKQFEWIKTLEENKRVKTRFNRTFFTSGDSREPELAGILSAVKGSLYT